MWFTDKKLDIGRRVYTHEISKEQACKEYDISITTVVNYVKLYLKAHNIPAIPEVMNTKGVEIPNYQEMTKNNKLKNILCFQCKKPKDYGLNNRNKTKRIHQ